MKEPTDITLLKNEQLNEDVWNLLLGFVGEWNKTHQHKFQEIMGFMLKIQFADAATPEFEELSESLKALESDWSIKVRTYSRRVYEDDDYSDDDYIFVIGISLDGRKGKPFVLNENDLLEPLGPCPKCGWQDTFDYTLRGQFIIDEALLDQPLADGTPVAAGGWDFVNAPAGHQIVSKRLADLLEQNNVSGYTLDPVLTQTGQESKRMFLLRAQKAILTPCEVHTKIKGKPFCPVCGAAWGAVEGDFYVREDDVGADEIFSRHRSKGAMLYVSNRIYDLFLKNTVQKIIAGEVIKICRQHGPG